MNSSVDYEYAELLPDALIICTRNRSADLNACLGALSQCSDLPSEILVIDSSEDCESQKVADSHSEGISAGGARLKYFHTSPGLTRQRNRGLSLMSSEARIVYFIDDDSVVADGYFNALREGYRAYPRAVGVGGIPRVAGGGANLPAAAHPVTSGLRSFAKRGLNRVFLMHPEPGRVNRAGRFRSMAHESPDAARRVDALSGCSMSFRADQAKRTLFDEVHLEGYSLGEDMEFCLRISQVGPLYVAKSAKLDHMMSSTERLEDARFWEMSVVNRHHFVTVHRDRFSVLLFWWSVLGDLLYATGARAEDRRRGVLRGVKALKMQRNATRSAARARKAT